MTAQVTVNGAPRAVAPGTTVWALLQDLADPMPAAGIAVAVNDEVVPRSAWQTTQLRPGDLVEVLTAMQGG